MKKTLGQSNSTLRTETDTLIINECARLIKITEFQELIINNQKLQLENNYSSMSEILRQKNTVDLKYNSEKSEKEKAQLNLFLFKEKSKKEKKVLGGTLLASLAANLFFLLK